MSGYNAAIGSLERQILPAARKFKDLQGTATSDQAVPELSKIESEPRPLTLHEEDSAEKKRASR